MSPETRAFLDAVRTAEDPTSEDERRVLSAVRVAIATGAGAGAAVGISKAAKLLGGGVATGVKVGGLVVVLGAAAWIASATLSTEHPARPVAVAQRPPSSLAVENSDPPAPSRSPHVPGAAPRPDPASAPPGVTARARPSASAPPTASSLRDEIALLAEVQAALARGDGTTALRRLDEHTSSDRRLLAERRAARILALCSVGRAAEAAQSASIFFREHPTSVQRAAVERSCAGNVDAPR